MKMQSSTLKKNTRPHWAIIHPFQLRLQRGIETYVWGLTEALAKTGIEIDVITWHGPLPVPESVKEAGVKIVTMPEPRYFESFFASFFYLTQLLKNHYDHVLVHFAGYGEGPSLNLMHWFKKPPYSVVFHFPPNLVPHRYAEFRRWHFDRDAEHLIAVSNSTASEVADWSGRQVDVIGHGVDSSFFCPDAELRKKTREQLGIPDDALVLITVAALEERKGIQWGIRAMQAYPSIYYLVVGDGPYSDKLKQLAVSLNLEKRILFLGFQLDVKPYLAASDLGSLLAYGEAFGLVLLEYAAMELPIVTSCHDPFPEIIQDAWGTIVDEQNTVMLSNLLDELSNPEKRQSMGKSAREWAIKEHNWDEIAAQYRELIR
jgi:glycosyltransferase involved in cell wall biosynthesis